MGDTDPEIQAKKAAHDEELRNWETAFNKYFDDNGVDWILTHCNTCVQPEAMTKEEYRDAEMKTLWMKNVGLAFGGPLIQFDALSAIPVPCLALPTPARHDEGVDLKGGDPLPVGVLIWGRPRSDKKLIQIGMALEQTL